MFRNLWIKLQWFWYGLGWADCTNFLQKRIDESSSLDMPSGRFKVSRALNISRPLNISGNRTEIRSTGQHTVFAVNFLADPTQVSSCPSSGREPDGSSKKMKKEG